MAAATCCYCVEGRSQAMSARGMGGANALFFHPLPHMSAAPRSSSWEQGFGCVPRPALLPAEIAASDPLSSADFSRAGPAAVPALETRQEREP